MAGTTRLELATSAVTDGVVFFSEEDGSNYQIQNAVQAPTRMIS
jgi:hypothetical protein